MSVKISDSKHDYLSSFESQLKEVWSQYVECLNQNGFNEKAKSLKDRYFRLYRDYRNNKYWKEMLMDN